MNNFIDEFIKFTEDAESPTSFFQWSAMSVLGAVMRDNVYYEFGHDRVYPNLYIILVADSGICRKGLPLKVGRRLIKEIGNTKIIEGRASMQGVLRSLAETETPKNGKEMLKGASGLLYSEELSSFIVDDPSTIPILTDWYDYHDQWKNTLVSTGVTELNNVCVSLLAASNEFLLKDVYTSQAQYGGLLARTFIIFEHKRRKKNSRMFIDAARYDKLPLIEHLKRLRRIKGEVTLEEDAKRLYDEWYNSVDDEQLKSKTGVVERIHTGVLKIALVLAAADPLSEHQMKLNIRKDHVQKAIELCWSLLKNYTALTLGSGKSSSAHHTALLIIELSKAKEYTLSKTKIMNKLWSEMNSKELEETVKTLEVGGVIIKGTSSMGDYYKLTQVGIDVIQNSYGERDVKTKGA